MLDARVDEPQVVDGAVRVDIEAVCDLCLNCLFACVRRIDRLTADRTADKLQTGVVRSDSRADQRLLTGTPEISHEQRIAVRKGRRTLRGP